MPAAQSIRGGIGVLASNVLSARRGAPDFAPGRATLRYPQRIAPAAIETQSGVRSTRAHGPVAQGGKFYAVDFP